MTQLLGYFVISLLLLYRRISASSDAIVYDVDLVQPSITPTVLTAIPQSTTCLHLYVHQSPPASVPVIQESVTNPQNGHILRVDFTADGKPTAIVGSQASQTSLPIGATSRVYVFSIKSYISDSYKSLLPSCGSNPTLHASTTCIVIDTCTAPVGEPGLVRQPRQAPPVTKAPSVAQPPADSNSGLTSGQLAAAIVVPIIAAILLAIAIFFLVRWIRSKRSGTGVYQPNAIEQQTNLPHNLDSQTILRPPPVERLV